MWYEFRTLIHLNDPITLVTLVLVTITCFLIIERFLFLAVIYNLNAKKFMANLIKTLSASDYDRAINLCKKTSKTGIPRIMERSIVAYMNDPTSVKGKLEEESLEFIPQVEARVHLIGVFANLILLTGLTGTALGIWSIFNQGVIIDGTIKQAIINSGVSRALTATIFSLMAATVILLSHALLRNGALKIIDSVDTSVTKLANLLAPNTPVVYSMATAAASSSNAGAVETDTSVDIDDDAEEEELEAADDDTALDEDFNDSDFKDEEEII